MLLSSVVLVLREVLEAALLFSLLMALSFRLRISMVWVPVALTAGLLGAAVYGFTIDIVSEWFDGVGQELVNAFLQLTIFVLLAVIALHCVRILAGINARRALLVWLMMSIVGLAVVREGSEILIYLTGFLQVPEQRVGVMVGSSIGAGIGASVGAVFYFGLLSLSSRRALLVGGGLFTLVGAGMVLQSTQLLMQADWLPTGYPVWDSDWLIPESSVAGQLLYALIGYEATPTAMQVGAYLLAIALLGSLWFAARGVSKPLGAAGE